MLTPTTRNCQSSLAVSLRAGFLPDAIGPDGHPDPTVADLSEDGALPSLAQTPSRGWREIINLAPKRERHYPIILERAVARALPM